MKSVIVLFVMIHYWPCYIYKTMSSVRVSFSCLSWSNIDRVTYIQQCHQEECHFLVCHDKILTVLHIYNNVIRKSVIFLFVMIKYWPCYIYTIMSSGRVSFLVCHDKILTVAYIQQWESVSIMFVMINLWPYNHVFDLKIHIGFCFFFRFSLQRLA